MHATETFLQSGPAEGERALAFATVYLATAPKSNRIYLAWGEAKSLAQQTQELPVPARLRNTPVALRQGTNDRVPYLLPHNLPGGVTNGSNLPREIEGTVFYTPGPLGQEATIAKRLAWWQERRNESSSQNSAE